MTIYTIRKLIDIELEIVEMLHGKFDTLGDDEALSIASKMMKPAYKEFEKWQDINL